MATVANAEETRREKARQLRYKKLVVKELNLAAIQKKLADIWEKCENVHWYLDTDEDTLVNALDGDEDEAWEFKMMFSDLCAECEKMQEDLEEEWVPDCFDRFFVAIGAGESYGGLLGYDTFEQDYFGISCTDEFAENEARKTLKRLSKDDLIEASRQCFRVYESFVALSSRYDSLKAALDILRDGNTGYLQMVKRIEELYEEAAEQNFRYTGEFDRFLSMLPQEAWIQ